MEYKYSDHELELLAKVEELQKEKRNVTKKDRRDHRNYRCTLSQLRNGKI